MGKMISSNDAALSKFHAEQDELERRYDPVRAYEERLEKVSIAELLMSLEEAPVKLLNDLVQAVRLQDTREMGEILLEAVENWIKAETK